ncbi:MAG: tryptophanase [Bacteroidia bacterium]|nr:tryptophanase [Bacteroidia bacterium]NNF30987.1 tryptophanase [Flavobacteriaceae bacterium]MBT8274949.1 tryptophanase [Bacteroidia bacterium]NNJ82562.1 tryptophanase [Flavobacteriaceae bacterium]NNK54929.1 tryptophanase [Flavobacteriaceae bacterium]
MNLPYAEPYKTKMVEYIKPSTIEERRKWIKEANYNLFNLSSDKVFIDLLTDSGTGAMSDKQWAEMMLGDESYAGSQSYLKLKDTVKRITGFPYFLPTHQGRAAENVLFSVMVKEGNIIPGNAHFDTTKGHIEFRKATALDCTIDEAFDPYVDHPFKGNIDLEKLEHAFRNNPNDKIPFVVLTVTCNTAGGQPVSIDNVKKVSEVCKKYNTPLIIDAARFAENAYFIKIREEGYADKSIKEISRELFSHADGMTMSAKKDGLVNMGGFIALRNEELYKQATVFNIMFEGFLTYGGMNGRDMGALAVGLDEATEFDYLETRINQVAFLGKQLVDYGIPVLQPFGGHAIFLDANKFVPTIPRDEYRAQALAVELYIQGGIRSVEIGTILADRDPFTHKNRYPELEMVRLAIPRRTYSLNHMRYIAAVLKKIYDSRDQAKRGYKIVDEAPIMRHFTVKLEKIPSIL